jgi:hypothetical protein
LEWDVPSWGGNNINCNGKIYPGIMEIILLGMRCPILRREQYYVEWTVPSWDENNITWHGIILPSTLWSELVRIK